MEIPPEKMAAYKRTARLRQAQRQREMAERRERAWQVARQAARLLKEEYSAAQVFVFGSLAHGAWFHPRSDIDLAAAGIPDELFFKAWNAVDYLDDSIEIDQVPLESAKEWVHQEVRERGIEL